MNRVDVADEGGNDYTEGRLVVDCPVILWL